MSHSLFATALFGLTLLASGATTAVAEDFYDQEIPPLTAVECAQCHEGVFQTLKADGGGHRQPCRDCHESFHNFSRQLSWAERVPACSDCHGQPHGEDEPMQDCLHCHRNAHAPVASLPLATLEPLCARCHAEPAAELARPSAHSDMACNDCHQQRHGYRPLCTECHAEPHNPFVSSQTCMLCHPVHDVSRLNYGSHVPNTECGGCHGDAVADLSGSHLTHSQLDCTFCHAGEHGMVPVCSDCHAQPHSPAMLEGASGCGDCHGNPHNLTPAE